ncbi:MAG: hypothetical protein AAFW00_28735 [Bacteroidota bacterium]
MIRRLQDKQVRILKALARYKFLTYKQMIALGIEKYNSNLSNLVKQLRESKRPLVRKIPHRNGDAAKFYLTLKGKQVLLELYDDLTEENLHYVKKVIYTDTQDQKHRIGTIDIQIALDQACEKTGVKVLWYERYFDTVGNNRVSKNLQSKTAILYEKNKSLKADLTFLLQTPAQQELYLLELENGTDSQKSVAKCVNHAKAIFLGSANEKYGFQQAYRTLWVFEQESIMQIVREQLKQMPFFENLTEYLLFKPLADVRGEEFLSGWLNIEGEVRKLYY